MQRLVNNKGLTLLEVVASIVIISIILITFSSVFLQSKKANVASQNVVDATYTAQMTMEELYSDVTSAKKFEEIPTKLHRTPPTQQEYIILEQQTDSLKLRVTSNPNVEIHLVPFEEVIGGAVNEDLVSITTTVKQPDRSPVIMEAVWRFK